MLLASLHAFAGVIHYQHWLFGAAPAQLAGEGIGSGLVPELGVDWKPRAAALPGQLCCQRILFYFCSYSNAEFLREQALQQGI